MQKGIILLAEAYIKNFPEDSPGRSQLHLHPKHMHCLHTTRAGVNHTQNPCAPHPLAPFLLIKS